ELGKGVLECLGDQLFVQPAMQFRHVRQATSLAAEIICSKLGGGWGGACVCDLCPMDPGDYGARFMLTVPDIARFPDWNGEQPRLESTLHPAVDAPPAAGLAAGVRRSPRGAGLGGGNAAGASCAPGTAQRGPGGWHRAPGRHRLDPAGTPG